ncbi:MAG TPA: ATPase, T2SS/T4P/T4SS family [Actinomycetota bacterium]|nr:ATPase, T2SS/T4P/T4SS family [Actinomycetota bacterium]
MLTRSLLERVLDNEWLAALDPAQRRLALRDLLEPDERAAPGAAAALAAAADHIDGYGPLAEVMARDGVTDVLVNGPHDVWAEQDGELVRVAAEWPDAPSLRDFADRLLARGGASADVSSPIADARLPDGSRIHVVLPPIAPRGPLVSIRRFPQVRFTLDDLVARGMLPASEAVRLAGLVERRESIVVSGPTGSGKTTLLNALLSLVPEGERVVTIEETPELGPFASHVVSLAARPPNVEGAGGVDLAALVRASLRMRPDRIVVGEVRGAEAAAALAAMATGHEGSMLTLHARSAAEAPQRLAALAGSGPEAVEKAVGAFVHVVRRGGRRRVEEIQS